MKMIATTVTWACRLVRQAMQTGACYLVLTAHNTATCKLQSHDR